MDVLHEMTLRQRFHPPVLLSPEAKLEQRQPAVDHLGGLGRDGDPGLQ